MENPKLILLNYFTITGFFSMCSNTLNILSSIRPWVRQANPPEEKRGVTGGGTGDPPWEIGISLLL